MLDAVGRRGLNQSKRGLNNNTKLIGIRRIIMILWMVSSRMGVVVRAAFSYNNNRAYSQSIRRHPAASSSSWFICHANINNGDDENLDDFCPGYNQGNLDSLFGDPDDNDDDDDIDYWMETPKKEEPIITPKKYPSSSSSSNYNNDWNDYGNDWDNKKFTNKIQHEKTENSKSVDMGRFRREKNGIDGVMRTREGDQYLDPTPTTMDQSSLKKSGKDILANEVGERRRRPPPVMEYDFSHYDDEFGEARPGEFGAADYIPEEILQNTIHNDDHQPLIIDEPLKHKEELSSKNDNNNRNVSSSHSEVKVEQQNYRNNDDGSLPRARLEATVPSNRLAFQKAAANGMIPSSGYDVSKKPKNQIRAFSSYASKEEKQLRLQQFEEDLQHLKEELFGLNKNKQFNINSPKQVSVALFGTEGMSTNKEALEALAATATNPDNYDKAIMADLILQTRQLSRQIKKLHLQTMDAPSQKNYSPDSFPHKSSKISNSNDNSNSSNVQTIRENPLLLLDASAFIFRAYYSMPPLHTADGTPVGAVLGFCNMMNRFILNSLCNGQTPRLALVMDSITGSQTRKDLYSDYKSNRKPCPDDLIPQFDLIQRAATAYGIPQFECPKMEADDVIATLATIAAYQEGCHVNILSADKDLMQLITPPSHDNDEMGTIHMIDPMTSARYTYQEVIDKWGVPPDRLGDLLALAGDSSDNIPGVPSIGPKIAGQLIQQYGTLDLLLESIDSIPQTKRRQTLQENRYLAELSRRLVELDRTIPLDEMTIIPSTPSVKRVSDIYVEPLNAERLVAFYDEMGFRDLKQKLLSRLATQNAVQNKKNTAKILMNNDNDNNDDLDRKITKEIKSPKDMNDPTSLIGKVQGNAFVEVRKEKPPPAGDYDEIPF